MTTWLTTAEVAQQARRHPDNVRRAAEEGRLHGHQPKRRGRWLFSEAAVEAWIRGDDGKTACGCARLRAMKRSA